MERIGIVVAGQTAVDGPVEQSGQVVSDVAAGADFLEIARGDGCQIQSVIKPSEVKRVSEAMAAP